MSEKRLINRIIDNIKKGFNWFVGYNPAQEVDYPDEEELSEELVAALKATDEHARAIADRQSNSTENSFVENLRVKNSIKQKPSNSGSGGKREKEYDDEEPQRDDNR